MGRVSRFIFFCYNVFYSILGLLFGFGGLTSYPQLHNMEPNLMNSNPIFHLTNTLYSISHSFIVFLLVFGIVCLIFRKPIWTMCAWGIHILIDIPSHSYQFYPTPVLWPISGWKFDGFSWANPWFLVMNYIVLIGIYIFLIRWERKRNFIGKKIKKKVKKKKR